MWVLITSVITSVTSYEREQVTSSLVFCINIFMAVRRAIYSLTVNIVSDSIGFLILGLGDR